MQLFDVFLPTVNERKLLLRAPLDIVVALFSRHGSPDELLKRRFEVDTAKGNSTGVWRNGSTDGIWLRLGNPEMVEVAKAE